MLFIRYYVYIDLYSFNYVGAISGHLENACSLLLNFIWSEP